MANNKVPKSNTNKPLNIPGDPSYCFICKPPPALLYLDGNPMYICLGVSIMEQNGIYFQVSMHRLHS